MSKTSDTKLDSLLSFDALHSAEQITGRSYKADEWTSMLGFALMQENGEQRKTALLERDDTVLVNDLARYQKIVECLGFEKVFEEAFVDTGSENAPENFYFIYAHRDGILLAFDTFRMEEEEAPRVNGGSFYYNWVPNSDLTVQKRCRVTSSGGMRGTDEDLYWVGNHDCREALVFNIDRLRANGAFLPVWRERAFLSLLHYVDWRTGRIKQAKDAGHDYFEHSDAITETRVSQLPEWVRNMVGPRKERYY